jgi:hypothetical protein
MLSDPTLANIAENLARLGLPPVLHLKIAAAIVAPLMGVDEEPRTKISPVSEPDRRSTAKAAKRRRQAAKAQRRYRAKKGQSATAPQPSPPADETPVIFHRGKNAEITEADFDERPAKRPSAPSPEARAKQ